MSIKGYNKLTEQQKQIFNSTYKKHQEQFEGKNKEKYQVISVKPLSDTVLKVVCKNGEWYHYTSLGTWY